VGRKDYTTGNFVIWLNGLNNEETKNGKVGERVKPEKEAIDRLFKYATRFLSYEGLGPELLDQGRNYRPKMDRDLPIVTSVSFADLYGPELLKDHGISEQKGGGSSGVWVCFGHGMYGVALGMGSGKLMSQMIVGDEPDFDVAVLDFPS
jgi:glycine/D-amino acid oxidase-like deaminating enzyme